MKSNYLKKLAFIVALILSIPSFSEAQSRTRSSQLRAKRSQTQGKNISQIEDRNVRAEMDFLAGDALQGRGSGTQFELLAGHYIASQLQQFGVEPAGETDASGKKTYIQTVSFTRNAFTETPKLTYVANGATVTLEPGKEMVVLRMNAAQVRGELHKISSDEKPKPGAVAFVKVREGEDPQKLNQNLQILLTSGVAAVVVEETRSGARSGVISPPANYLLRPLQITKQIFQI